MTSLIESLVCRNVIKEHDNRVKELVQERQKYSALVSEIGAVVFQDAGGIYKRIAENLEILEQLNQGVTLNDKESNLYYLLSAHHQFLINLAVAIKTYAPDHKGDSERFKIEDIDLFRTIAETHDKAFQNQLSLAAMKV